MRQILLSVLASMLLCSAPARAVITLTAADGTDPEKMARVQTAIDSFQRLVQTKMGLRFEQRVTVYVCPSQSCYEEAYRSHELPAEIDSNSGLGAHISGGVTLDDGHLILLNLASADFYSVSFIMTHELTHALQHQLVSTGEEDFKRAPVWLVEGMADWIGAQVNSEQDMMSVASWQENSLDILRSHTAPALSEMSPVLYSGWQHLQADGRVPYQMADAMMLDLVKLRGEKIFPSLRGYYECLTTSLDERICFKRNFGVDYSRYMHGLEARLKKTLAVSPGLELIDESADPDAIKVARQAFTQTQAMWQSRYGTPQALGLRLHLSQDQKAMHASIVKEFGYNVPPGFHAFRPPFSRTVWLNTQGVPLAKQQAAYIATMASRYFLESWGNVAKQYFWLQFGLTTEMGVDVATDMGLMPHEEADAKYTAALLPVAHKLPRLVELNTEADFGKAVSNFDVVVLSSYAATAARILVGEKGYAAVADWIRRSRTEADAEQAFVKSFGQKLEDMGLEERVQEVLEKKNTED